MEENKHVQAFQYLGHRKFGLNGYRYKRPKWLVELFRQGKLKYSEVSFGARYSLFMVNERDNYETNRFIFAGEYIVLEEGIIRIYQEEQFNDLFEHSTKRDFKLDKRRKMLPGDSRYRQ